MIEYFAGMGPAWTVIRVDVAMVDCPWNEQIPIASLGPLIRMSIFFFAKIFSLIAFCPRCTLPIFIARTAVPSELDPNSWNGDDIG